MLLAFGCMVSTSAILNETMGKRMKRPDLKGQMSQVVGSGENDLKGQMLEIVAACTSGGGRGPTRPPRWHA